MKKYFIPAIFIVLFLFGVFGIYAVQNYGAKGAKTDTDLTLEDKLVYAIQDEYLARAEYYAIMNKFGDMRIFSNIVKAEETHVSYLIPLFEKYGFKIPVDNSKDHVIIPENIKKSLEIGVQAEIENIAMYDLFLKKNIPQDVYVVFKELKKASENHLNAFKNNLNRY